MALLGGNGRGQVSFLDPEAPSPALAPRRNIVVMAVKGPGDSLGLVSLDAPPTCSALGGHNSQPVSSQPPCAKGMPTANDVGTDSVSAVKLDHSTSCTVAATSADARHHLLTPVWQACVRVACKPSGPSAPALLLRAKISGLRELVALHPELESALRNIAGQQDTDLKVAEALRQLRMTTMSQDHQRQIEVQRLMQSWDPTI